jgi:hypothetical protein
MKEIKIVWHYGHFPPIASSLYLKVPEHNMTFLLLANTSQLSDSYGLQEGDVTRSPYASLFLNHFVSDSPSSQADDCRQERLYMNVQAAR